MLKAIQTQLSRLRPSPSAPPPPTVTQGFLCNACYTPIESQSPRYTCIHECGDFDLCTACALATSSSSASRPAVLHDKAVHPHALVLEASSTFELATAARRPTLGATYACLFKAFAHRPLFGTHPANTPDYQWLTYDETARRVYAVGRGLQHLRLIPHLAHSPTAVAIYSPNCLEWVLVDMALTMFTSALSVPLAAAIDPQSARDILQHSQARCCVVHATLLPQLEALLTSLPELTTIIVIGVVGSVPLSRASTTLVSLEDIESVGLEQISKDPLLNEWCERDTESELEWDRDAAVRSASEQGCRQPGRIFTLMYTSGSTGMPKGCVFLRSMFLDMLKPSLSVVRAETWMSFFPLAHNMDRRNTLRTFAGGGRVGFATDSLERILDSVRMLHPTIVAATPRFWAVVRTHYDALVAGASCDTDLDAAEKHAQSELRALFGPKLHAIITGGAQTPPADLLFLQRTFRHVSVYNGYGATEVGSIVSDGHVSPDADVKLADVPDMGYLTSDKPHARGEILVRTEHMIAGYYRNSDVTSEAFTADGYFRTGDIGSFDASNGTYSVIDRIKNIFKLAQGEFVSAQQLESLYAGASSLLDQVYIYGSSAHHYVMAVVVVSCTTTTSDSAQLEARVLEEMRRIAADNSLEAYKVPRAVIVTRERFTDVNGLLTVSHKLCRPALERRYKTALESLVHHDDATPTTTDHDSPRVKLLQMIARALCLPPRAYDKQGVPQLSGRWSDYGADSFTALQISSTLSLSNVDMGTISWKSLVDGSVTLYQLQHQIMFGDATQANPADLDTSLSSPVTSTTEKSVDWDTEEHLDPHLRPAQLELPTSEKHLVLLTGSTGFLGREILLHLQRAYRAADTTIVCHCRSCPANAPTLTSPGTSLSLPPLVYVVGDLRAERLGLTLEWWNLLRRSCTLIVHNGALVNHSMTYARLRPSNVQPLRDLLADLCTSGCRKSLHYVSSTSAVEHSHLSPAEQTRPRVDSGYALSKWVCEKLVVQAQGLGFDCTIHRPGHITPCALSGVGHANQRDWLYTVLRVAVAVRALPEPILKAPVSLTAVERVASGIVRVAQDMSLHNKVYTWASANETTVQAFANALHAIDCVSGQVFQQLLNDATTPELEFHIHCLGALTAPKSRARKWADGSHDRACAVEPDSPIAVHALAQFVLDEHDGKSL